MYNPSRYRINGVTKIVHAMKRLTVNSSHYEPPFVESPNLMFDSSDCLGTLNPN